MNLLASNLKDKFRKFLDANTIDRLFMYLILNIFANKEIIATKYRQKYV
jgi:hypothetical protein